MNLGQQSVGACKETRLPEFCIYGFGLNLSGMEVIKTSNLNLTENEPSEARMVVLLSAAPTTFAEPPVYVFVLRITE